MAAGGRDADAPRAQIALLCGLIAIIVTGEFLIGPPAARAWTPLDVFLAAACFTAAGMLLSARLLGAGWMSFALIGGAILASALLPLINGIWLLGHALALAAGVAAGAILLVRR